MKKMEYTKEPFAVSGPTRLDEGLARMCKALGHPARVAILRRLIQADRCFCGEIVDGLPLSQATVSQHLKVLKQAGLIDGEVSGPRTCYCADFEALARLREALAECCGPGIGPSSDPSRGPSCEQSWDPNHDQSRGPGGGPCCGAGDSPEPDNGPRRDNGEG